MSAWHCCVCVCVFVCALECAWSRPLLFMKQCEWSVCDLHAKVRSWLECVCVCVLGSIIHGCAHQRVCVCVYSFIYVLHVLLCTRSCLTFSSAPPTQSERLIVKEQTGVQKFAVLDVKGGTTLRLNQHRPTKRGLPTTSRLFTAALRLYERFQTRSSAHRESLCEAWYLFMEAHRVQTLFNIYTQQKILELCVDHTSTVTFSLASNLVSSENLFGPFVRITHLWDGQHDFHLPLLRIPK